MKKSRTGLAILLILFLVAGFVVVLVAVSIVSDSDKETSTWNQVFESGNKIGIINIEGTITSSDETLKQLRKYSKKSSVKAILIRINSPGGTVAPAQEINWQNQEEEAGCRVHANCGRLSRLLYFQQREQDSLFAGNHHGKHRGHHDAARNTQGNRKDRRKRKHH
jgi:vacuolar-type H+-ATPase subunit F/Vma7